MRWLADECVAGSLVGHLRAFGHDVDYAAETAARCADGELLTRADAGRRLLLTEDKDFGELVFLRSRVVPGLVLLRVDPARPDARWERLQAAIDQFHDNLFGRFIVIDSNRIRSRPLPLRV